MRFCGLRVVEFFCVFRVEKVVWVVFGFWLCLDLSDEKVFWGVLGLWLCLFMRVLSFLVVICGIEFDEN